MILLNSENWFIQGVKQAKMELGQTAELLALIVEDEVADVIAVSPEICEKLINATGFEECSINYPDPELFCVKFNYEGTTDQILSNEMIYSILLSDPIIIKIIPETHKYGHMVKSGWSYLNGQFVIPGEYE